MSDPIIQTLDSLIPPYHPLAPNPTREEVARAISTEPGRAAYLEFLRKRKKRIEDADEETGNPFLHGWELDHWKEADEELRICGKGQYIAGGKRATKTERAAWRLVTALHYLERGTCWALQGTGKTARAEQHKRVWRYLPKEVKAMNGRSKHVGWAKIDYNIDRGFGNDVLVMPSKSELHFITYNQKFEDFQGWELGFPDTAHNRAVFKQMPWLFNIGGWADEDMPLDWLETLQVRCATRDAVWMWTYSTLKGITAAIKSLRGSKPQIIRTARAELLPENQVHVPGCPPGHMPICERAEGGISIFYFWTQMNPFPPNYKNVKALVAGKPRIKIQRDAYGYDEDTKGRAYPNFGRANIITAAELPDGTNYKLTDPAGNRMWATIWVRVTDEDVPRYFIFADWPDEQRFGDWAEPGGPNEPDGKAGPAQDGQGYGWIQYKRAWREVEQVKIPSQLRALAPHVAEIPPELVELKLSAILDRDRRAIVAEHWVDEDVDDLFIHIEDNFIDPRAGNDEKHQKDGSLTAIDALAEPHTDPVTGKVLPGVFFRPASGISIETGRTAINALLAWDPDQPLMRVVNEPKLYVVDTCKQVIGMFNEFTGTGKSDGGWKDFDDLVRYMATSGLSYVPKGRARARRQGSY